MFEPVSVSAARWRSAPPEQLSDVIVAAASFVVVSNDQIVEVSPQLSVDLGISPKELLGRPLRDLASQPVDVTLRELIEGSAAVNATALPDDDAIPVTVRRLGGVGQTVVFEVRRREAGAPTESAWPDAATRAVSNATSLGVFTVTRSGSVLFATNFVHRLIEELAPTASFDGVIDPEHILGIFAEHSRDALFDGFHRGFNGETVDILAETMATEEQWLRLSVSPAPGELVISVVQDVTELIQVERRLRESTRLLEALDMHSDDLVLVFDREGQSRFVSESVRRMAGHDGVVTRREALSAVHPQDMVAVAELYERTSQGPAPDAPAEPAVEQARIMVDPDLGYRWHDITVTNLLDDPDIGGVVWTIRDSHDRHAAELELEHRATHDELTGLPERVALLEFLEMSIQADSADQRTAVLFCDVDDFKDVNDQLGHAAGDVLLTVIAERLRGAVRDGDLVARYGGDEFVIVAPALADFDEAADLAQRVFDAFRGKISFAGMDLDVGVSVGVATSSGAQSAEALVQQADIAMYEAKRNGRGRIEAFTAELTEHATLRARTEAELVDAVEHGELRLHYQPIRPLDVQTGLPIGMEALARWDHPEDGLVGPDRFIAFAEESGFISVLGSELLRMVVNDVATWPSGDPVFFAVNMSTRQLSDTGIGSTLLEMIRDIGLEPQCLTIEITEESLVPGEPAVDSLTMLHQAGVRVFLDDFGTGHSSMMALHSFPVSGLKIDRSLISPALDETFVRSVVGVANSMGILTVAEGIEEARQLDRARALGVHYGQGYLLGRPEALDH
ncbi:MAG: putative bifunctional diguanylate cyclase/phosphodiesterase [Acidimicrobiales bacterium]